jgi:hypothetical protein
VEPLRRMALLPLPQRTAPRARLPRRRLTLRPRLPLPPPWHRAWSTRHQLIHLRIHEHFHGCISHCTLFHFRESPFTKVLFLCTRTTTIEKSIDRPNLINLLVQHEDPATTERVTNTPPTSNRKAVIFHRRSVCDEAKQQVPTIYGRHHSIPISGVLGPGIISVYFSLHQRRTTLLRLPEFATCIRSQDQFGLLTDE